VAIHFATDNAALLLSSLKKAVDDSKIVAWSYDSDGDFTHATDQWRYKAWLRPKVLPNELIMYILGSNSRKLSKQIYAIYHGRFVEAAVAHADTLFTTASISALLEKGDHVGGTSG